MRFDLTCLQDRKAALQEQVGHLELGAVNAPENLAGADAASHSSEASINETHDTAALCTRG